MNLTNFTMPRMWNINIQDKEANCEDIDKDEDNYDWFLIIGSAVIIVFGTTGNTIAFLVLRQKGFKQNVMASALRYLAFLDNIILWTVVLKEFIMIVSKIDLASQGPETCRIYLFYSLTMTSIDNWLLVVITLTRLIHLKFPFRTNFFCSRLNYYSLLASMHVLPVAVHGSTILDFELITQSGMDKSCSIVVMGRGQHVAFYAGLLNALINFILPGSLLLIFNGIIARGLREVHAREKQLQAMSTPVSSKFHTETSTTNSQQLREHSSTFSIKQDNERDEKGTVISSVRGSHHKNISHNARQREDIELKQMTVELPGERMLWGEHGWIERVEGLGEHMDSESLTAKIEGSKLRCKHFQTLVDHGEVVSKFLPLPMNVHRARHYLRALPESRIDVDTEQRLPPIKGQDACQSPLPVDTSTPVDCSNRSQCSSECAIDIYPTGLSMTNISNNAPTPWKVINMMRSDPAKDGSKWAGKAVDWKQGSFASAATVKKSGSFSKPSPREAATDAASVVTAEPPTRNQKGTAVRASWQQSNTTIRQQDPPHGNYRLNLGSALGRMSTVLNKPVEVESNVEFSSNVTKKAKRNSRRNDSPASSAGSDVSRQMRQRAKEADRRGQRVQGLTRMLMAASAVFFFLNLPYWTYHIVISSHTVRANFLSCQDHFLIFSVTSLLRYANHSVNFFFYIAWGSRFREEFYAWVRGWRKSCRRS